MSTHGRLNPAIAVLLAVGAAVAPRQFAFAQDRVTEQAAAEVEDTFDPNGPYDNDGLVKDPGTGGDSAPWEGATPADDSGGSDPTRGGTPPANDTCPSATEIPGSVVTYNPPLLNTAGATNTICDAAESCESGNVGTSNSVWYRYSPALDGTVTINTFGSSYNTVLSVWTDSCGFFVLGNCLGVPTQLACNDDYPFGDTSQVTLAVTAGETYRIKVADYNTTDGGGLLDFNLIWAPANDICADATIIPGVNYDPPTYSTANAAGELCENEEACEVNNVGTSNSVWYSYTPACDGLLSLNTNSSSYDTVLSIWDKCGAFYAVDFPCNFPEPSPVEIACDDDSGTGVASQLIDVPVTGGQTYLIKVADYNTANGGGVLNFNLAFVGADPPTAAITSPPALTCVCGAVNVQGSASAGGAPLTRTLEYQPAGGSSWTLISFSTTPVIDGTLGTWNTVGLAQDYYLLRLTVQNSCGLVSTAVTAVFVDAAFDSLDLREPDYRDIVAGTTCVDGTLWDRCFGEYTVMYRPSGGGPFVPVDPGSPTYNSTVVNDPLAGAGWDTTSLADGDYELRVEGSDLCGHAATTIQDVTVDNTPPTAVIDSPLSCALVEGTVEINGTADDAHLAGWMLQYAGAEEHNWVTIQSGTESVGNGLLGLWDTTRLAPCAYTLRLVVTSQAVVNCDDLMWSEYLITVSAGELCPVDLDGDGDQDLLDYAEFEACFTGPQ